MIPFHRPEEQPEQASPAGNTARSVRNPRNPFAKGRRGWKLVSRELQREAAQRKRAEGDGIGRTFGLDKEKTKGGVES